MVSKLSSSLAMAEGTRMKSLEENIRRLEQLQQDQERWIAENAQRFRQWMESSNETTKGFQLEIGEFRKEMCEQKTQAENLQSQIGQVDQKLEAYQGNTDRRLENLTGMVRNSNRFHEQELARGSANSVPGNVSANVNLPNRRPNLAREAPGSSSMEWNQKSSERSSAGGPELRGDVRAQEILTQNQDLATRRANWQQNNEQRFESLTSIVRNISRDREQELQGNNRRPQLNAESSARNTAPAGANLGSSSARNGSSSTDSDLQSVVVDEVATGFNHSPSLLDEFYEQFNRYQWGNAINGAIPIRPEVNSAQKSFKLVILNSITEFEFEAVREGVLVYSVDLVDWMSDSGKHSMEFLVNVIAHKVFVEMPSRIVVLTALVDEKITNENGMEFLALKLPYDRGKCKLLSGDEDGSKFSVRDELVIVLSDVILALFASGLILFGDGMVIFDPGGVTYIVQWSQHSAALDTIGDYADSAALDDARQYPFSELDEVALIWQSGISVHTGI